MRVADFVRAVSRSRYFNAVKAEEEQRERQKASYDWRVLRGEYDALSSAEQETLRSGSRFWAPVTSDIGHLTEVSLVEVTEYDAYDSRFGAYGRTEVLLGEAPLEGQQMFRLTPKGERMLMGVAS